MIVFTLWLFTSAYAVEVAAFPNPMACAMAAVQMAESFDKPPKPFLYRMACMPTIAGPPRPVVQPPEATGPSA